MVHRSRGRPCDHCGMRTLMIGTVAVAVAAMVLVLMLSRGSVSPADAANRIEGKSVRGLATIVVEGEPPLRGTVVVSADATRFRLKSQDHTIVSIGDQVWRSGSAFEGVPKDKPWIRSRKSTGSFTTGPRIGQILSFEHFATTLRNATEVQERGETELDGAPVTHFTGRSLDAAGASYPGADNRVVSIECWLDEDATPIRIRTERALDGFLSGKTISVTVDKLEFDVPTDAIKAPPSGETRLYEDL
jgi:hypothetical protein